MPVVRIRTDASTYWSQPPLKLTSKNRCLKRSRRSVWGGPLYGILCTSDQDAKEMNDSASMSLSRTFGAKREAVNMNGMKKRPDAFCVVNSVIEIDWPSTLLGGASRRSTTSVTPC